VPSEAVLDTGERQTVFVDRGNGYLEPRQVEIGQRLGDRIQIRSGLKPGERIVVSGNFLIDSESQIRSAVSGAAAAPAGEHPHD
jgi:multidrug efflux pump subunit AcrA (membrane-fusion protein)